MMETTTTTTATTAIVCVLVLTAFAVFPAVESAPQEEGGLFAKFTKIFKKLTGEGIQASCSAIPSMLDSIVPACLECEEGTWKIKSGLGLLKCRKSKKAAKNDAGSLAGGVGGAKALTAAALILLVLFWKKLVEELTLAFAFADCFQLWIDIILSDVW